VGEVGEVEGREWRMWRERGRSDYEGELDLLLLILSVGLCVLEARQIPLGRTDTLEKEGHLGKEEEGEGEMEKEKERKRRRRGRRWRRRRRRWRRRRRGRRRIRRRREARKVELTLSPFRSGTLLSTIRGRDLKTRLPQQYIYAYVHIIDDGSTMRGGKEGGHGNGGRGGRANRKKA